MAKLLDVAITTCSIVGEWLDKYSGQNHPELKNILRPEVADVVRPLVECGQRLRDNNHRGLPNSKEDMDKAQSIFNTYLRYESRGDLDEKKKDMPRYVVAYFGNLYLNRIVIPELNKRFDNQLFMDNPNIEKPKFEIKKCIKVYVFYIDFDGETKREDYFYLNDGESYEDAKARWFRVNAGCYYEPVEVNFSEPLEVELKVAVL